MAEQGNNNPQTLPTGLYGILAKTRKIFIFNDRNLAKKQKYFLFFMAERSNNKPQTLLKVYMASQEKEEKIYIFNDRNLAKNKNIF